MSAGQPITEPTPSPQSLPPTGVSERTRAVLVLIGLAWLSAIGLGLLDALEWHHPTHFLGECGFNCSSQEGPSGNGGAMNASYWFALCAAVAAVVTALTLA